MKIKKIVKPNSEPWEMPALITWASVDWPMTTTFRDNAVKKDTMFKV